MHNYFTHVVNGQIKGVNIRRGGTYNGKRFGMKSPDSTYAKYDLFPQIGDKPEFTDTQRLTGPVITWDAENLVANKVWGVVDISLDELKAIKKGQLDQVFNTVAERPVVDTGLGFEVNGGYQDLADFTVGEDLGITIIRAVDNSMNDVTEIQFKSIILAIKMNGLTLKQNKWALADSITAATTIEELDLVDINEGW